MIIGYARVSTTEQNLDLQLEALKEYGCERIYQESVSTRKNKREQLERCLESLRTGDKLVVWKFDRLDRDARQLMTLGDEFRKKGIDLASITQNIDTSTSQGKLMFGLFAILAEHERDIIRERTLAGLAVARANGRKGGRRFTVDEKDQRMIKTLMNDPTQSPTEIAKRYGISRATAYKIANDTYLQGRKATVSTTANTAEPVAPKKRGRPKKDTADNFKLTQPIE